MLKFPIFMTILFKQELHSCKEAVELFFFMEALDGIGHSICTIQDTQTP